MTRLVQVEGDKVLRQVSLNKRKYSLGRGAENDIVFETSKVSRSHAQLIQDGESYAIVDQNSTNHVFVNGELVQRRTLASGDKINLSKEITLLYFCESDTDHQMTELVSHMWDFINKKDFLRLKEVTDHIVSLDSLHNILKIVLDEVVKLVGAERGFISLVDNEGHVQSDTSVTYNIPLQGDFDKETLFSHSTVRRAIQYRTNVFILNTGSEDGHLSESMVELELQSVMCAPLLFDRKLVGILYVDSGTQFFDFNEMDRFFFTILSDHAAIAIENAKLYQQANKSIEQLRAEVYENEERYRYTLELTPDPIAIARLSDARIVLMNNAFCQIFGCCKEKMQYKSFSELKIFAIPDDASYIFARVARGDEIKSLESRFRRNTGEEISVLISARFIHFIGEDCVILVAADITLRKEAEEALEKAMLAAEAANQAKNQFLGRMSHEFRTPMNVIMGMTHLAFETEPSPKIRGYLEKIARASDSLMTLINDVLDFSRIETGELKIENNPFDLKEFLLYLHAQILQKFTDKQLSLDFYREPDVPCMLIGDPLRLKQILINLLDNALKFTEHGRVNLHISVYGKKRSPFRPKLLFALSDSGIGIVPEKLPGLFDLFTQGDGTHSRKYGGTGIGLAICKRLVMMMGGRIWVESTVGKGSTFFFNVSLGIPVGKTEQSTLSPSTDGNDTAEQPGLTKLENPESQRAFTISPELVERLRELSFLLEEGDLQAIDSLNAVKDLMHNAGDEFRKEVERMANQMHNYDFHGARKMLAAITASLDISLNQNRS